MKTINQQLGIGIPNRNVNIKSRYTRGLHKYQPQLGTEDWSLDFYNDRAALQNMSNASGEETFSNLYGRNQCRDNCKSMFPADRQLEKACDKLCETTCTRKSKCGTKGDTLFPTRSSVCINAGLSADCKGQLGGFEKEGDYQNPETDSSTAGQGDTTQTTSGLSKGAKVGIVFGLLAVVGVGGYLIFRK